MKTSWLYAKNPVVIDKDLAGAVGLNEAILLRRIGDQLYVSGKDIDGRRWIKCTVSEFLEKDFPYAVGQVLLDGASNDSPNDVVQKYYCQVWDYVKKVPFFGVEGHPEDYESRD